MMAEKRLVRVGPKTFDSIDRGRPADVLPGLVADGLMPDEFGVQASVAGERIGVDGSLNRDVLAERGLEFGPGGVGDYVHLDDPIGQVVDAEHNVLKLLGAPTSPNLSGLPELRSLPGSSVFEVRPEVRLVDLYLSVQEADGLVFERLDGLPELEVEAVDPVVGTRPPARRCRGQCGRVQTNATAPESRAAKTARGPVECP